MLERILRRLFYKMMQDMESGDGGIKVRVIRHPHSARKKTSLKKKAKRKVFRLKEGLEFEEPQVRDEEKYKEILLPGCSKKDIFYDIMRNSFEVRAQNKNKAFFYMHPDRPKKIKVMDGKVRIFD